MLICFTLQLIRELDSYSGRIQQRKGSVTRSTQLLLFGEELPRGHGYKGKLSSKISLLFDEITGRSPRKRSSRHVDHPVVMNPKRMILRPQAVPVGVIGDGVLAMLLVERLLQKHNQVIVWNKESLSAVQSDVSFSPILSACSPQSLQWQASLQTLVSHCSVILVAVGFLSLVQLRFPPKQRRLSFTLVRRVCLPLLRLIIRLSTAVSMTLRSPTKSIPSPPPDPFPSTTVPSFPLRRRSNPLKRTRLLCFWVAISPLPKPLGPFFTRLGQFCLEGTRIRASYTR